MKDTAALVEDGFLVTYIPELRSGSSRHMGRLSQEKTTAGLSLSPFPVSCSKMSVSTPLHLELSGKDRSPEDPRPS